MPCRSIHFGEVSEANSLLLSDHVTRNELAVPFSFDISTNDVNRSDISSTESTGYSVFLRGNLVDLWGNILTPITSKPSVFIS